MEVTSPRARPPVKLGGAGGVGGSIRAEMCVTEATDVAVHRPRVDRHRGSVCSVSDDILDMSPARMADKLTDRQMRRVNEEVASKRQQWGDGAAGGDGDKRERGREGVRE